LAVVDSELGESLVEVVEFAVVSVVGGLWGRKELLVFLMYFERSPKRTTRRAEGARE
jgi:hypothetical protein